MSQFNVSSIVTALQEKINSITTNSNVENFILPNIDALDIGKTSMIETVNELPDIYNEKIPDGQLVYIKNINTHVVSVNDKWVATDGRLLRDDSPYRQLYAWGCNAQGQLGVGTTISYSSPVSVLGGFTDWCYVESECNFVAALRTNGELWTWGNNGQGQLGDCTLTSRSSPVSVTGNHRWCSVSVGASHMLAIKSDGTAWGWGGNNYGEVGNVSGIACIPVANSTNFNDWKKLGAGRGKSIGLRKNGTAWVWGGTNGGGLGAAYYCGKYPVPVAGNFTDWCDVTAGGFALGGVRKNCTAWTWGGGITSIHGNDFNTVQSSPVSVLNCWGWNDWENIISVGSSSNIAKRQNKTLWSWGNNTFGLLGDCTKINRSSPVSVLIFENYNEWIDINIKESHGLAIKNDGTLWAWGENSFGKLGINLSGYEHRSSPVSVVGGFTDWCTVSVGSRHTAVIKTDGTLWAWGNNNYGQLGDDSIIWNGYPKKEISESYNWCTVSAGCAHTAAIRTDGTLWTWGRNNQGQIGDGTTICRSSPVSVVGGFTDWCTVSIGLCNVAAIRSNGTLWTWGNNSFGQIGDGTTISRSSPVSVVGDYCDWCIVSAGGAHTAAIRTNGTIWTWGRNNQGQIGDGTTTTICRSSPVSVVGGFTDWCTVSSGCEHTAAIRTDGTLWTWGRNTQGQLGVGTTISYSSPVSVLGGFTDWCLVSAGNSHTAAIRTNGTLWTWGWNSFGQIGDGTVTTQLSPVSVVGGFTDWCTISSGCDHTAAIRTDGTLWTWGYNCLGKLGDITLGVVLSPINVVSSSLIWCKATAGINHSGAIRSDGTIWTWGSNSQGRLGDGTDINRSSPVSVVGGFTDWCDFSIGCIHTAAIRTNGTLWTWGVNINGILGDETTLTRCSPVSVVGGFTDWCTVSAGASHTAAIRTDGTLWSWGCNGDSQLGDGTNVNRSSPVSVVGGFTDWCTVNSGFNHTAAMRTNGTLWTWGLNSQSQLGDGTFTNSNSPVSVVGGFTDWCTIGAGAIHTAAIRTDGTLWSWGSGIYGRTGLGKPNIIANSPRSVIGDVKDWCALVLKSSYSAAAIRTNGTLWTWGNSVCGALGTNSGSTDTINQVVGGFTDWCQVNGGNLTTLAIRANGTLWSWGCNNQGGIGDGTTITRSSPVSVLGGYCDWYIIGGNTINGSFAIRVCK